MKAVLDEIWSALDPQALEKVGIVLLLITLGLFYVFS